jgi:hypothetical protein
MFILSCERDINSGTLKVELTDSATTTYDHIYIDIEKVSVHYSGAQEGSWIDLPTNTGIYDLLLLANDVTVILADEKEIPIGRVSQIRLLLRNNNTIVVGGQIFDLKIPSGYETGIKVQVYQEIKRNQRLLIVLDFDAEKSILQNGTGDYSLHPVVKVKRVSYY